MRSGAASAAGRRARAAASTTFSREPSASRASTIGCASSRRRPARAASRTQASRSASASSKRSDARCRRPAALDPDLVRAVHDHLGDARIVEQPGERIGPRAMPPLRPPVPRAPRRHRAAPAPRGSRDGAAATTSASAANARAGGGRPRSRARGTRGSGFTDGEQRQTRLRRDRLRGARAARRVTTSPTATAAETEPGEQQCRRAARPAHRVHPRSRRSRRRVARSSTGIVSTPRRDAAVDDCTQTRSRARGRARARCRARRSDRRARAATVPAARGRARRRRAPAAELGRRRHGTAGDPQQRVGVPRRAPRRPRPHRPWRVRDRARRLARRTAASGDGAGRRSHATAGAEQGDVALVVVAIAISANRSSPPRRAHGAAPRRRAGARVRRRRRSRAPAAQPRSRSGRRDQQHARARSP